jgi:hypothetical protein
MLSALLLLSAPAAPEPPPRPAPAAVKVLAQAPWTYSRADLKAVGVSKHLVLRSAAELVANTPFKNSDVPPEAAQKQATAALANALRVPTIDWGKQMVVVVSGGTRSSGGYRVEVTKVEARPAGLTVHWKLHPPTGFAIAAFTHPAQAILLPRSAGKVTFDPPGTKK